MVAHLTTNLRCQVKLSVSEQYRQISDLVLPACYTETSVLLIECHLVSYSKGTRDHFSLHQTNPIVCASIRQWKHKLMPAESEKQTLLGSQMISEINELMFKDKGM